MNSKKEKLLNDTYYKWIQTSLYDLPLGGTNDFVDWSALAWVVQSKKDDFISAVSHELRTPLTLILGPIEKLIKGMPLGAIKDFPYEIRETEITPGDTLLLLSDGLPELQNELNEHYGYGRVKEAFEKTAEKEPEEIINYFKNESSKWVNGKDPDDDVTFVVIKVK